MEKMPIFCLCKPQRTTTVGETMNESPWREPSAGGKAAHFASVVDRRSALWVPYMDMNTCTCSIKRIRG